jgi:hypothetical protein
MNISKPLENYLTILLIEICYCGVWSEVLNVMQSWKLDNKISNIKLGKGGWKHFYSYKNKFGTVREYCYLGQLY